MNSHTTREEAERIFYSWIMELLGKLEKEAKELGEYEWHIRREPEQAPLPPRETWMAGMVLRHDSRGKVVYEGLMDWDGEMIPTISTTRFTRQGAIRDRIEEFTPDAIKSSGGKCKMRFFNG